ncbi:MAG: glycosyltransferase [Firmicutes bacterium]|nr:glycosyltransferase [Bacillota bacterium]
MTVSVIIPAFNEEARVAESVAAAFSLPGVREVIVADDGSRDATAARATAAGARVLRLPHRGKGQAVAAAVAAAQEPFILLADADLGDVIRHFGPLLDPVRRGEADMTIGVFGRRGSGGGVGAVVRLARWGVRRLAGVELTAPLSGQRAATAQLLRSVDLEPGFGLEVGLDIDVARRGGRLLEVTLPVAAAHAVTGRSVRGFLHRGRQFWAVARALWRRRAGTGRRAW